MRRLKVLLVPPLTAALAAGCRPDLSTPTPGHGAAGDSVSLVLAPDSIMVPEGGRRTLFVLALDHEVVLPDAPRTFTTRDPSIAAITSNGLLLALAPGRTFAVVQSGLAVDSVPVIVSVVPWTVTFPDASTRVAAGTSIPLATVVSGAPEPLVSPTVIYTSGDSTIATVSSTGAITGLRAGTVWIRARLRGSADSTRVEVFAPTRYALDRVITLQNSPGSFALSPSEVLIGQAFGLTRLQLPDLQATGTVPSGTISDVAVTADGATAFIVVQSQATGGVYRVDLATGTTTWLTPLMGRIALSDHDSTINLLRGTELDVFASDGTAKKTVPLSQDGGFVLVSVPSGAVYALSAIGFRTDRRTTVSEIQRHDTTSRSLAVNELRAPNDMAASADGRELYIADLVGPARVYAVSGDGRGEDLPVSNVLAIAGSPDGEAIIAARSAQVVIVDRRSRSVVQRIDLPLNPLRIAFDAGKRMLILAHNQLFVFRALP